MRFGNFKYALLFLLFSISSYGQNLEDQIYNSIDAFVANPTSESLKKLNQNVSIFKKEIKTQDEQLALVILYCNKGSFEMKSNKQKEAIASYENAWLLFSKNNLSNYDIIEYCLKPLGTLYTKSSNFTLAENTIKQYIFMAEKEKNEATIISGYINLSIVYKSIGNHKTALTILNTIAKNTKKSALQSKRIQEEITVNLIGLKKYDAASNSLNNESNSVNDFQNLKTKAFFALQNKKYTEANSLFAQAKILFCKKEDITANEVARLYVEEANLYEVQNELNLAKNAYLNAIQVLFPYLKQGHLPLPNNLYADSNLAQIFDGLAKIETNYKKKSDYFQLAFQASDWITRNLVSQESQFIQANENRIRTENYIEFLWQTYLKTKESKHLLLAFQYAEKSKNLILKNRNQSKKLLELHPKNKNLQLQEKLVLEQELLTNQIIRLQITQVNPQKLESITNQLTNLSIALKTVNEKVDSEFPQPNSLLNIEALHSKLNSENTQLFYFFWGKKAVYQFYQNNNKLIVKKIKLTDEFIKNCTEFIHYFDDASKINNDLVGFLNCSYQLYKKLGFEKVAAHKNTLIIPDGLLSFVPFDALVTKTTTSSTYNDIPFLVKQNKIVFQTNAQFYIDTKKPTTIKSTLGVFPVFENTNATLLYSKEEAKSLVEFEITTLLMHEKATKKNFISMLPNYDILHISTHGTSGTFNEPATLVFYDDVLLLQELYALRNCKPQLVVLSACETGIGKLQKGEGAISIARGFQYAGAKNVLFSLWKINDYAAAQWMHDFYKNKAASNSFYEANYHAKIDYLNSEGISNAKKSPYYWSAFVYYGTIDTQKTNYFYYYLLGIISIIILFLSYGRIARFLKRKKI